MSDFQRAGGADVQAGDAHQEGAQGGHDDQQEDGDGQGHAAGVQAGFHGALLTAT